MMSLIRRKSLCPSLPLNNMRPSARKDRDDVIARFDVDHGASLAHQSTRTWKLIGAERIETAICSGNQDLVGSLRMEAKAGPSPSGP
jgi:hypothetical protein